MNKQQTELYIETLLQPFLIKIQSLQKENDELKKRVDYLEHHLLSVSQKELSSSKGYMKSTISRQMQMSPSKIARKDDDCRSQSGGKNHQNKPGWKTNTKIQSPKPQKIEPISHQKLKLKPPIPRRNSKTPTKGEKDLERQKSPIIQKKITGGKRLQAEKNQNTNQNYQNQNNNSQTKLAKSPNKQQNLLIDSGSDKADFSESRVSKTSTIKLGKPTIYIQKQSKSKHNSTTHTPNQTPLQRSSVTEVSHKDQKNNISNLTKECSSPKLAKSQISLDSKQKEVLVQKHQ